MTLATKDSADVQTFISKLIDSKVVWGLQSDDDGWVVCDSTLFESTDVMPLWSSLELAKQHCTNEWADYTPEFITLADFLEFWVEDLNEDGVLIGLNWLEDEEQHVEIDVFEFAQALAAVESQAE